MKVMYYNVENVYLYQIYDANNSGSMCQFKMYVGIGYVQYKYTFSELYIPQPCGRRAQRNPPTYIQPPSVGMIYPTSTYIFNHNYILPKLLASYIQYKYTYSKLYIPLPCVRRAQRNHPTYIRPQSVGMIYPISTYILK